GARETEDAHEQRGAGLADDRLDVRAIARVVAAAGWDMDRDARTTHVVGEPVGGGGGVRRADDLAVPTSPQLLGSGEGSGVGGRLHLAFAVEEVARVGGQADQGAEGD